MLRNRNDPLPAKKGPTGDQPPSPGSVPRQYVPPKISRAGTGPWTLLRSRPPAKNQGTGSTNCRKWKAPVMMWGYGQGMGWMWLWVPLLLIGIALLVLLAVRVAGGGIRGGYVPGNPTGHGSPPPMEGSRAREILDERFARGELTADQYREQLRVLGEGR